MSLIAGTLRISFSVISPSSLQCIENSDCSASPSEAGGYSTLAEDEDAPDDEVVAAMERGPPAPTLACCRWNNLPAMNGTEREFLGPQPAL
mmetsp:Transcript_21725/g.52540  ORF Transcript_21725/g.52540 Transcript_21725/m.52540 type:complete len:91 (+) Transcript_21725:1205-1477(+)